LEPDLAPDVARHRRLESRLGQGLRQHLDALRDLARRLAEAEAIALHDLDHRWRGEHGGRIHDTTNHPRRVDVTSDLASGIDAFEPCALECSAMLPEIPPRDSVLHGHNAGRSIIEVMEVARDRGDLMRLDREQDAVLWACVGHCLHGFYIL